MSNGTKSDNTVFLVCGKYSINILHNLKPLIKANKIISISTRAQWDFKNCLEELAHMFFYVKLNFKLGLFSSTF